MKFYAWNSLLLAALFVRLCVLSDFSSAHKHSNQPLILLASFDGFRWDYLNKYNLTNFNELKKLGTYADYIYNSFATVTFPNHWTMVTGLYEESHGIVHNEIYDPVLNEVFNSVSKESHDHKWYGQNNKTEPVWITNQKNGDGRRSAASWVGSSIKFNGIAPIHIPYNYSRPYNELIDQFILLFTSPDGPINFGAIYFDEPDATGHKYGPYSKQMEEKLYSLDKTLGYLISELKSHHLFDKLNLIITSDHGMEEVSEKNAIYLDSYVDTGLFDAYGKKSSYNLFLKKKSDLDNVYNELKKIDNVFVYKKADIPKQLHYTNNIRIGDILIIARLGYQIVKQKNSTNDWSHHRGDHGFMNNQSSMYPIFISHGPGIKANHKIHSFFNVDLYPLLCFLLNVKPVPNNGSLANVIDMMVLKHEDTTFPWATLLILLIPVSLMCTPLLFCFLSNKKKLPFDAYDTRYRNIEQNDLLSNYLDDDDEL